MNDNKVQKLEKLEINGSLFDSDDHNAISFWFCFNNMIICQEK